MHTNEHVNLKAVLKGNEEKPNRFQCSRKWHTAM